MKKFPGPTKWMWYSKVAAREPVWPILTFSTHISAIFSPRKRAAKTLHYYYAWSFCVTPTRIDGRIDNRTPHGGGKVWLKHHILFCPLPFTLVWANVLFLPQKSGQERQGRSRSSGLGTNTRWFDEIKWFGCGPQSGGRVFVVLESAAPVLCGWWSRWIDTVSQICLFPWNVHTCLQTYLASYLYMYPCKRSTCLRSWNLLSFSQRWRADVHWVLVGKPRYRSNHGRQRWRWHRTKQFWDRLAERRVALWQERFSAVCGLIADKRPCETFRQTQHRHRCLTPNLVWVPFLAFSFGVIVVCVTGHGDSGFSQQLAVDARSFCSTLPPTTSASQVFTMPFPL